MTKPSPESQLRASIERKRSKIIRLAAELKKMRLEFARIQRNGVAERRRAKEERVRIAIARPIAGETITSIARSLGVVPNTLDSNVFVWLLTNRPDFEAEWHEAPPDKIQWIKKHAKELVLQ